MKTFIALALMITTSAWAQSVGPQDVEPMLQQMQASGQIDAKQAEITRQYMKSMDAGKWAEIEKKAKDCITRNPAAMKKMEEEGAEGISMDLCK